MATRGRKPLPTALKLLEGDRGKGRRPINAEEPTPPQNNVKCPNWLMPEAKKEWQLVNIHQGYPMSQAHWTFNRIAYPFEENLRTPESRQPFEIKGPGGF